MKKILSLVICLIVITGLTGCNKIDTNKQKELTDTKTGVKVSFDNDIDADTKLEVKELDNYIRLSDSINKYVAYDISLVKYNGDKKEKVEPGNVTVSIKIPDNYDTSKLAIYYISNYIITEEFDVYVDGKYAKFNTNHFSGYVLAELNNS